MNTRTRSKIDRASGSHSPIEGKGFTTITLLYCVIDLLYVRLNVWVTCFCIGY